MSPFLAEALQIALKADYFTSNLLILQPVCSTDQAWQPEVLTVVQLAETIRQLQEWHLLVCAAAPYVLLNLRLSIRRCVRTKQ
jgi:hypothetical protein